MATAINQKLSTKDLPEYATTVDEIETVTGINFFPNMGESGEDVLNLENWLQTK